MLAKALLRSGSLRSERGRGVFVQGGFQGLESAEERVEHVGVKGDREPVLEIDIDQAVKEVEDAAGDEGPEVAFLRKKTEGDEYADGHHVQDERDGHDLAEHGVSYQGEAKPHDEGGVGPAVDEHGVDDGQAGNPPKPPGGADDSGRGFGDGGAVGLGGGFRCRLGEFRHE